MPPMTGDIQLLGALDIDPSYAPWTVEAISWRVTWDIWVALRQVAYLANISKLS